MGGNTLLEGGRYSDFFRYKVRLFPTKTPTKFGQFIYKLLTIIFNRRCRVVGGGFSFLDERRGTRDESFFCYVAHFYRIRWE